MTEDFDKAWELVKAAPCGVCGAMPGDRCGKNVRMPANRCRQRKNAAARGFDNSIDLTIEDITPPDYITNRG